MNRSKELADFDCAMDAILRADPKAVKEAMEKESLEQAKDRSARGERKRGRKPPARFVRIRFDSLGMEKQAEEFFGLMSLGPFQGLHHLEPSKILELFLNLVTTDTVTATGANGTREVVYRARFTADFDRFCAALRAREISVAIHILEGLQKK